MAVAMASVSEFADDYLGSEPGVNLSHTSESAVKVLEVVGGDEAAASPLVATMFWQAYTRSPAFHTLLAERAGVDPSSDTWEAFVIRHPLFGGEPRHDLIVLSSAYVGDEPLL